MKIDPLSSYSNPIRNLGAQGAHRKSDSPAHLSLPPKAAVQVSLSSPLAQLHQKAAALQNQEAALSSSERVDAARAMLSQWSGLNPEQIDDLADLLLPDIEDLGSSLVMDS